MAKNASVKVEDLRAKTPDELKAQLMDLRKEQLNLRFQMTGGQLENTAQARFVRRAIARVKTVLGEKANNNMVAETPKAKAKASKATSAKKTDKQEK